MKIDKKKRIIATLIVSTLFGLITVLSTFSVQAQSASNESDDRISLPPREEKFTPIDAVVGLWEGCYSMPNTRSEPRCENDDQYKKAAKQSLTFTLYDADGSVWWRVNTSRRYGDPDFVNYAYSGRKEGFEPLLVDWGIIVLRAVGESANWYEVEINETTQKTKFVHKSDPAWAKTTWEYWMGRGATLPQNVEFRDAPDGKLLDLSPHKKPLKVNMIKTQGDWAYVEDRDQSNRPLGWASGWIKWRNGRDLLIGCVFNDMQVPQATGDK